MIDWDCLDRTNARLCAFTDFDRSAAFGEGPLGDLGVGVKANIAVRGLPWTGGMAMHRNRVAERDAEVVARLRSAGAAIVGSLNMHEAALGATSDNRFFGRTINPHREGFTAGGSSGGSGAAAAAGMVDAALGTDTLGSVRIPASYCGVYGLKPAIGSVSTSGLMFLDARYDVIGPLARELKTLERVWRVIGQDAGEGTSFAHAVTWDGHGVEVQPAVHASYERALEALGLEQRSMRLDTATSIRLAALAGIARSLIRDLGPARTDQRELVSPELHFVLDSFEAIPEQPDILERTRGAVIEAVGSDGVLVMPTTPQVAFAHGGAPPNSQADFTGLASIAGLPALSIPAGTDGEGLPIGVQLVGPAGSESRLIALARQLEPALGGAVPLKSGA